MFMERLASQSKNHQWKNLNNNEKRISITHREMTAKTDDTIMVHAEERVLTSSKLALDTCQKRKHQMIQNSVRS